MCSHTLRNSRNNPRNDKIPTGEHNFPPAQLSGFANDFLTCISQNLQIKQKILFSTAQKPFSLLKFSWLKPRTFISASLCLIPSIPLVHPPSFPELQGEKCDGGNSRNSSDGTWTQNWSKSTSDLSLLLTHFHLTLQNSFYKISIKLWQKRKQVKQKPAEVFMNWDVSESVKPFPGSAEITDCSLRLIHLMHWAMFQPSLIPELRISPISHSNCTKSSTATPSFSCNRNIFSH